MFLWKYKFGKVWIAKEDIYPSYIRAKSNKNYVSNSA